MMMKVRWRAAVVLLVGAVVLPICCATFLPILLPPLWRMRHGGTLSNDGITVTLKGGWTGYGIPDGVRLTKPSWEGKLSSPLSVRTSVLGSRAQEKPCSEKQGLLRASSYLLSAVSSRSCRGVMDTTM